MAQEPGQGQGHEKDRGDDIGGDVLKPDVLLPLQYFSALKRKKFPVGEHRLVIALMRDAVDCFQKYIHSVDTKRRQLYLDADAWIGDEDDRRHFSFNNVCELLGLNSKYVREGLLGWRDSEHRRARTKRSLRHRSNPIHTQAGEQDNQPSSSTTAAIVAAESFAQESQASKETRKPA